MLWIFVALLVAVVLWLWSTYNYLVTLKNMVRNSWSQIDVQLQRRYDLIPNLVETVKGYMTFEKGTLQAVIEARNQAAGCLKQVSAGQGGMRELAAADGAVRTGLGQIFALAENYPQLKASEPMKELQEELRSTENRVAFSRQSYNDQVMRYNIAQEQFPARLIAARFGHRPAEQMEVIDKEARKTVRVQF